MLKTLVFRLGMIDAGQVATQATSVATGGVALLDTLVAEADRPGTLSLLHRSVLYPYELALGASDRDVAQV